MGILSSVKKMVSSGRGNKTYSLTQTGKVKHDHSASNTPTFDILVCLNDYDSCSIREICEHTGMDEKSVRRLTTKMCEEGLIQERQ